MNRYYQIAILFLALTVPSAAGFAENPVFRNKGFRIERIAPSNLFKAADGCYFIDFGKDAFGTLELNYKASGNETLNISLGEKLLDGKIDPKPGGSIRFAEIKLPVSPSQTKYTIQLIVDKRNTGDAAIHLPDSLGVVMPFRYAEIRNASQTITSADVRQKALFHYFDLQQSDFSSSDTILNQVWNLCKYSMKATSFTGIYIDGDRERIAYEADAYINQLGHYAVDREYFMARATLEHFMTHPTWPTEWQLHVALMAYQDYYYSGDTELLKKYYNQLKYKTLIDLAREDGLISTTTGLMTDELMKNLGFTDTKQRLKDIVDWPPGQKDTNWKLVNSNGERDGHEMLPINTVVNCFFYENMKVMAEIAGILKKNFDKARFEVMAEKVKKTINQKLLDPAKGYYIDGEGSNHSSLHSNMVALAFGLVPEANVKSVVDFVKSRGMACSVYGSQFLLEGLYRYNEGQYALDLLRSTGDRGWWNMIRSGSTISLEAWDMKYKPNSDWNHAWGAAPANIIPRCLWGIRPKVPGYSVATIHPQMGDLKSSSITVPTLLGPITVKYSISRYNSKGYLVELPPKMTAEIYIDHAGDEFLRLNQKKFDPSVKLLKLNPGKCFIEVRNKSMQFVEN
ncbi:MAG: alpha-L-rhamnosidase C-terminal domain-containing protein [Prolixibacteraceae bacterium]